MTLQRRTHTTQENGLGEENDHEQTEKRKAQGARDEGEGGHIIYSVHDYLYVYFRVVPRIYHVKYVPRRAIRSPARDTLAHKASHSPKSGNLFLLVRLIFTNATICKISWFEKLCFDCKQNSWTFFSPHSFPISTSTNIFLFDSAQHPRRIHPGIGLSLLIIFLYSL